jgi:hypothetical protein
MTTQPSTVPANQSATLVPPDSVQFQTSSSVNQTLTITNTSVQEAAEVQINCSSWDKEKPPMPITINPFKSYNHTTIFGGAPMLFINVTNPNNPATINITLNIVGT